MQFYMQRQISELLAITSQTTKSMEDHQARSTEIDKTLAELRTNVFFLMSASVSSIKTQSVSSDKPCQMQDPQVPFQTSGHLSLRHAATALAVLSFPNWDKTKNPLSCKRRMRPLNSTNKTTSFFAVQFLTDSLVAKTRTPSRHFCDDDSIPGVEDQNEIRCTNAATMPVTCFFLKQLVNNSCRTFGPRPPTYYEQPVGCSETC